MPDLYLTSAEIAAIRLGLAEPVCRFWLSLLQPEVEAAMAWDGRLPAPCDNRADWIDPRHSCHLSPILDEPDVLVSPVDGCRFAGPRRASASRMLAHEALSHGVRSLALQAVLTDNDAAASQARRILDAYSVVYEDCPISGPQEAWMRGKMLPYGLMETTWILALLWGADLLRQTGRASDAEWTRWRDGLFLPFVAFIHDQTPLIHNIRCWYNTAVGSIGLAYQDKDCLHYALDHELGWHGQLSRGMKADGTWGETSVLYQFYCLQALVLFGEAALRHGHDLYRDRKISAMVGAAIQYLMPDMTMLPLDDTQRATMVSPMVMATLRRRFADRQVERIADRRLRAFEDELPAAYERYHLCRNGGRLVVDQLLHVLEVAPVGNRYALPSPGKQVQTVILRDDARGHLVAMEFGSKRLAHRHYERLGLVAYLHGSPVLIDRGAVAYHLPIYDFYRYTPAHNTVACTAWHHLYENSGTLMELSGECASASVEIHQGVIMTRTVSLLDDRIDDEIVVHNRHAQPAGEYDLYLHPAGVPVLGDKTVPAEDFAKPYFGYEAMTNPRRFAVLPGELVYRTTEGDVVITLLRLPAGSVAYLVETPGPGDCPETSIQALVVRCPAARELRYQLSYQLVAHGAEQCRPLSGLAHGEI